MHDLDELDILGLDGDPEFFACFTDERSLD